MCRTTGMASGNGGPLVSVSCPKLRWDTVGKMYTTILIMSHPGEGATVADPQRSDYIHTVLGRKKSSAGSRGSSAYPNLENPSC